jgi:hypothetical protein
MPKRRLDSRLSTDVRFRRVNNHLAAMSGVAAEAHIGAQPEEVLGGLGAELAALYRSALAELAQLESEAVGEAGGHPRDDIALLAVRPREDRSRADR